MKSGNTSNERNGEKKVKEGISCGGITEKIRNIYTLESIYKDHLKTKRLLNIIKYNKTNQIKFKINISNYKEFSGQYSSIEIEIIPMDNKYGKFININNVNDKQHYHIYFNDDKMETERNYINDKDKVSKIRVIIGYQIQSFENLFYNCDCIKSINFKKFSRININNMSYMFSDCSSLSEINLDNFKTDNVTNMSRMFYRIPLLVKLNLSNFNTIKVNNMNGMFYRCPSLVKLDLSNFNTNNVCDMSYMFYECSSLKELNLINFNTNNVYNMKYMFYGCSSLKELNLINFNTNKVYDMCYMFYGCSSLKILNISDFNFEKKIYVVAMFEGCSYKLKNIIKKKFELFPDSAYN